MLNVCIIAQVDHGKTTLADSLVARAGKLSTRRAGTAAALDTNAQEQARGITIFSSAVRLDYDLDAPALRAAFESNRSTEAEEREPEDADDILVTDVYVGNVPFDTTEAELAAALVDAQLLAEGSLKLEWNAKRGFARLHLAQGISVTKLRGLSIAVQSRGLTLQPLGASAVHSLRQQMQGAGASSATLRFTEEETQDGSSFTATVEASGHFGPVILDLREATTTRKAAREAVASKALATWFPHHGSGEAAISVPHHTAEADDGAAADETRHLVLNLIDCPGHLDFNSEVTAALRSADTALLVVDVVEGVTVQTKRVLAQAVAEGLRPLLVLNKVDRLFLELQHKAPESARRVLEVLHEVNELLETPVSLANGSAILASGYFGWAVSVPSLLRRSVQEETTDHATRDVDATVADLLSRLLAAEHRRAVESPVLARAAMRSLTRLHRAAATQDTAVLERALGSEANAHLRAHREDATASNTWKAVFRGCMKKELPAADALLEMLLRHAPTAQAAQPQRLASFVGLAAPPAAAPTTAQEWAAKHIAAADPAGPALVFFTKFVPLPGSQNAMRPKLGALGRVFSGTIHKGGTVRLLLPDADGGGVRDLRLKGLAFVTGPSTTRDVASASVGDVVLVPGLADVFVKTATLVPSGWGDALDADAAASASDLFRPLPFEVSPVVSAAVRAARPSDASKLQAALRTLARIDPCVVVRFDEETEQTTLVAAGELHLDVSVQSLRDLAGVDVVATPPRVTFRETLGDDSSHTVEAGIPDGLRGDAAGFLGKSANKLNRFWFRAFPLAPRAVDALEAGMSDADSVATALVREGWTTRDARRAWAAQEGSLLLDATYGSGDLGPVRDAVVQAFRQVVRAGPLAGERVRGVAFLLTEATIHSDGPHRSPMQVVPACVRAMRAAFLGGVSDGTELRVLEPRLRVTVESAEDLVDGSVYEILGQRDGAIVDVQEGLLVADMPATKSFGMASEMRHRTKGQVSPELRVDGWMPVAGAVTPAATAPRQATAAEDLVRNLRAERHMEAWVPLASVLADKL